IHYMDKEGHHKQISPEALDKAVQNKLTKQMEQTEQNRDIVAKKLFKDKGAQKEFKAILEERYKNQPDAIGRENDALRDIYHSPQLQEQLRVAMKGKTPEERKERVNLIVNARHSI